MNKSELLKTVNTFLEKTSMAPTALGLNAKGDPNFVFMLRKGRECRESTQEKVLAWMAAYEKEHGAVNAAGATSATEVTRATGAIGADRANPTNSSSQAKAVS